MISEIPSMLYGIKNTDITDFVCKLHTLAGDYLREAEYHLHALSRDDCMDYIALVSNQHIRLDDAAFIYKKGTDLHQGLFTSEFHNGRAFLLHVQSREDGHAHGDVLLLDCATLCKDVENYSISPVDITATDKNGRTVVISLDKWVAMELYEKDALRSWGDRYTTEDNKALDQHRASFFAYWMERADEINSADLLLRLNSDYMRVAQNPQWDMYRIPIEIAKQILLYNDASVYRLLPHGPEQIQPITAITTGLWYYSYREFAVKPEGLPGLYRACQRQAGRIIGQTFQNTLPEKPHPTKGR